jgi:hypothetical protein
MTQDFDRWLERELDKGFTALTSLPVPSEARYRPASSPRGTFLSRVLAGLGKSRLAVPVLAAALIGGGGTAFASAATGTHPVELGQQVSSAVVTCKDRLTAGEHGIGECVSEFVIAHSAAAEKAQTTEQSYGRGNAAASERGSGQAPIPSTLHVAGGGPADNHGSSVSDVARTTPPGEGHDEAVSAAARGNGAEAGKKGDDRSAGDSQRGTPVAEAGSARPGNGRSDEAPGRGRGLEGTSAGNPSRGSSGSAGSTATTEQDRADRPGQSSNAPGRSRGPADR